MSGRDDLSWFKTTGLLALVTLALAAKPVAAQDLSSDFNNQPPPMGGLSVQAVGTETGYFDTNPLLETAGAKALFGSITTPELIVHDETPMSRIDADTSLDVNQFNQTTFNSNDAHSKINFDTQNQLWELGLNGNIDYDTTRTSELSTFGFHINPVRHLGGTLSPVLSSNSTPADRFSVLTAYTASQYASSIFTDYETTTVTPGYTHKFDELNSGIVQLQAQQYRSTSGQSNTVDTINPSIGWQRIFTEQLSGTASVGVQETRQYGAGILTQPWSTQYTFNGALNYKTQQDKTGITLSRQQYPFGNGTEALLTTFGATEMHELNERFAVNAGASYQTTSYQATAVGSIDSLTTLDAGLIYHATDRLDVVTAYQYRYETLTGTAAKADEQLATVSLSYRPAAWGL